MPTERACSNCDIPLDANSSYCSKCGGKAVEKGKTKSAYDAEIPMASLFKGKSKPKSAFDVNIPNDYLFKDKDFTSTKSKILLSITIAVVVIIIGTFMESSKPAPVPQWKIDAYNNCMAWKIHDGWGPHNAKDYCTYNFLQ